MGTKTILLYTWEIYAKNFGLILLAALPGLFGLIIPVLVGLLNSADPVYIALGGAYLRTGSIVDLGSIDTLLMVGATLVSLYLMSFAIVGINLVVKRQRTLKRLRIEEVKSVAKHTNSVFVIFLIGTVLLLLIQIFGYEYQMQRVVAPVLSLIVGFGILFLPAAMVMDEARAFRALQKSFWLVEKKPGLVLQWMVIALALLSVVDLALLGIVDFIPFLPFWLGPVAVLVFNSLIILPFLVVLLAQIYISKYTILVD